MRLKPKKSLGQNFLVERNIQRKIIDACKFNSMDNVLEIGAGRGELTKLLTPKANKIYALEIDKYLCEILKHSFKENKNIKIINQDILKFNLNRYFHKLGRVMVVGNIPYYISSGIIEHLFKFKNRISSVFITVQKEFARRITAIPGSKDYGSLTCFVQYHAKPKIIFYINRGCFFPVPKVDSCLLRLEIREEPEFKIKNDAILFNIIRKAFNQRRKTLRNSLKGIVTSKQLELFFNKYGISCDIRPESLALKDFVNLAKIKNK